MPIVSVRIPQIGEGLQEARLVAVLKQVGDHVRRDEPIYQMETDKAVMDVESPYEGVLSEWMANPDDVLAIGAEVAKMEVVSGTAIEAEVPTSTPLSPAAEVPKSDVSDRGASNLQIPPRTRAYAKEKNLSEADLASVPCPSGKLMPSDIDAYLAAHGSPSNATFDDRLVPGKQRVLNSRMVRGNQLVVPGTITVAAKWRPIEAARAQLKSAGGDFQPSSFTIFAYAVAQVVRDFPALKTSIQGEDLFRTYRSLSLGIAVSLPGDELVLAVVPNADQLGWREFAASTRVQIDLARGGKDQANEQVTLSLTNMQSFGLRDAVPVVVPPSVATLFLGEVYLGFDPKSNAPEPVRYANLAMTFDHRVLNGVGAAQFLNQVREKVEQVEAWLPK